MTALADSPFLADEAVLDSLAADFRDLGAAVLGPDALGERPHAELLEEARRQRSSQAWHLFAEGNGEISQDNMRSHLGPAARTLLASPETARLLERVTGLRLAPDWSATCFTHYDRPGSYLGEHCDKPDSCHVGMLIYLDASWPGDSGPSEGMRLQIFAGDNSATPLRLRVTARTNRILILFGSRHAHRRPPLAPGESVTLLAGCFRQLDDGR